MTLIEPSYVLLHKIHTLQNLQTGQSARFGTEATDSPFCELRRVLMLEDTTEAHLGRRREGVGHLPGREGRDKA